MVSWKTDLAGGRNLGKPTLEAACGTVAPDPWFPWVLVAFGVLLLDVRLVEDHRRDGNDIDVLVTAITDDLRVRTRRTGRDRYLPDLVVNAVVWGIVTTLSKPGS